MKCPKCRLNNPVGLKFCGECGTRLETLCSKCELSNTPETLCCEYCGHQLEKSVPPSPVEPKKLAGRQFDIEPQIDQTHDISPKTIEGERKHVTVLFSDLSGYTALSERLDPEEVKEIMSRIFGKISQVIVKYDGFIEKYVGDAIMALFGATGAYEDNPVRAIRAAREIHAQVASLGQEYEATTGLPLCMHTGINTGLVVTGEMNMSKGTHGFIGDTINVAARMSSLGKAGDIIVGQDTHQLAEGHFVFKDLGFTKIKGKSKSVRIYKVVGSIGKPRKVHRIYGLRSKLIGRKLQIAQLTEAADRLSAGAGSVIFISGAAGTGKSRLIEEFKAVLDLSRIQWFDGHSFSYCQNIPYYPLIDLFSRVFKIEENDPPSMVREKIESHMTGLLGPATGSIPFIANLFSIHYPEIEQVSPDFWKSSLQKSVIEILTALSRRAPTAICIEDIHWADPSSIELINFILAKGFSTALFICVYRPSPNLFNRSLLESLTDLLQEIQLAELSPEDTIQMLKSLLKSEHIPVDLLQFVKKNVEGNPFYLEEFINTLIESKLLVHEKESWAMTRSIAELEVPLTIHEVIAGRIGRLPNEMKRILQEASVLGRTFLHSILARVTEIQKPVSPLIKSLEKLDLIKMRSTQPEPEYIFKHALIHDVVYNGLLIKDRQKIHERVGTVMEELCGDRLADICETLAYHFKRGRSLAKAVHYLIQSGQKNLSRFSLEESHHYFQDAYNLLTRMPTETAADTLYLIDLIIQWAMVFHHRGDFKGMEELFRSHEPQAAGLNNEARLGEYYMWLGQALHLRLKTRESYQYLTRAFELGRNADDIRVMGWASAYLPSVCAFLGYPDEEIFYEKKAIEISKILKSEHFLFIQAMASIGYANWSKGDTIKALETGNELLEFGKAKNNIRGATIGRLNVGHSFLISGDYPSAIKSYIDAINVSGDPFHTKLSQTMLGICYLLNNQLYKANEIFPEVINFSNRFGAESMGLPVKMFLGAVQLSLGRMGRGWKMIQSARKYFYSNEIIFFQALSEYILGNIYLELSKGSIRFNLPTILKNTVFLITHAPFSYMMGKFHFKKAFELGNKIGAKGVSGQACLGMGLLHKAKGRPETARRYFRDAIAIFEQSHAESFLNEAKEAFLSLE